MPRPVRFVPALVWTVAVLLLSVMPPSDLPGPRFPGADKLVHGLEFFVLAVLVTWAALGRGNGLFLRVLVTAPIMALLAGLTELLQIWVPGRSADPFDLVADVTGIALGALVTALVMGARRGRRGRDEREP